MKEFYRRTELPLEALQAEFEKGVKPCFWLNEIGVTTLLGSEEAQRAEAFLRSLLQTSEAEMETATSYAYLKTLPIPLPETKDALDEFENDPLNQGLMLRFKAYQQL